MTNDQLVQIEDLKELSHELEKFWKSRVYSNITLYQNFDFKKLSESKKKQYDLQIERAPKEMNRNNGKDEINFFEKWKIQFFVTAEWIVADWARRHHLSHIDYNEVNPYSPIDCSIEGVNIDVKTTVGLARLKAIPLYSRLRDHYEIQIAIISESLYPRTSLLTNHAIQGIFDPSEYTHIDIPLEYFPVKTTYKNSCYFQPLENYFNIHQINVKTKKFDMEVLEHWLKNEVTPLDIYSFNFNLCTYLYILRSSPKKLHDALRKLLPKIHHDFIPTVIELANKKKITLLPHYLADYLVAKIKAYAKIDANSFINIIFSIYYPNKFQREFLLSLIKLIDVLPEVRCKWHPDEGIKDMGFGYVDGYIPTYYFKCQQNPKLHTTIYSYSWKTQETVIYKINPSCNDLNCGGLTHQWEDLNEWSLKWKTMCKNSCEIHGKKAQKKITEQEIRDYYSNDDTDNDKYDPVDDIPF